MCGVFLRDADTSGTSSTYRLCLSPVSPVAVVADIAVLRFLRRIRVILSVKAPDIRASSIISLSVSDMVGRCWRLVIFNFSWLRATVAHVFVCQVLFDHAHQVPFNSQSVNGMGASEIQYTVKFSNAWHSWTLVHSKPRCRR